MGSRKGGLAGPLVAGGGLLAAWLGLMAMPKCDRSEPPPKSDAWPEATATATANRPEFVKQVEPAPTPPPATLAGALGETKPLMADSVEQPDRGALLLLGHWTLTNYPWAQLAALPETTYGRVRKDSDVERGKRVCGSGEVVEIEAAAALGRKIHGGRVLTDGGDVLTVWTAGSTGTLERGSRARFCGVATGRHTYANSGGGTTQSVMLVGLFDLPENRKAAKP